MSMPRDERLPARRILSHLAVMVAVAGVLGIVVAGLAIPFAGVLGIGARNAARTMDNLPAALETDNLPQKTTIVDPDGTVIATLFDQNRVNVSLDQISRNMTKAIVSIEDYRFYQHGALDIKGTLRALITNQASSGVVQGGSSITQQLVKLTLVDQAKTKAEQAAAVDDTYARKLKELRYAVALEDNHTKDWILERYLNTAYFGDGAYGIQAAARHYFDVNARNLDVRQSALLAGLVKNPNGYAPTNYPARARERRNVVLDRMAELGVISQKRADRTGKQTLGLNVRGTQNGCVNSRAPFFCDYVLRYLMQDPSLGRTSKERLQLLKSGGLTIETTINLVDQLAADDSVKNHVGATDPAIGGLAMVEPRTGRVLALAQSRPMGSNRKLGETYLNYTVPQEYGDATMFQAGSTFKPFVLATAINKGIPLSTTFNAQPKMTFDQANFANCPDAPPFAGTFDIGNATSSGVMDVYRGTRESVNTFYMQLEQLTGVCDPFNLAKAMGIRLTSPTGDAQGNGAERVPTFTLGVDGASPLEMAEAYATFGGRGLHCDSHPVTEILDANGNVVKQFPDECTQVMPETTADAVNDVLRGVQEPGGFGYDLGGTGLSVKSAGKTGTTQNGNSVWFMGYTPQIATAAMIAGANELGSPASLVGTTINGNRIYEVSGSGFAGPMWAEAMHVVDDNLDDIDFTPISPTDVAGAPVAVPAVGGLSIDDAIAALQGAGFVVADGGIRASDYDRGTVAYSYPAAEAQAPSGSTITVYESSGPEVQASPTKNKGKGSRGRGRGRR